MELVSPSAAKQYLIVPVNNVDIRALELDNIERWEKGK